MPVWLSRRLGAETGIRVDKWFDDGPPPVRRFQNIGVSYKQANPPHPVIFVGSSGSLERYRAMAAYIRKMASPPSIYHSHGEILPFTPPTASSSKSDTPRASASPIQTVSSSSSPAKHSSSRSSKRPAPCMCFHTFLWPITHSLRIDSSRSKALSANKPDRNKFEDTQSPLMPRALPTWMAALKRAGGNRQPSGPLPSGVRRGYALPDPNVIANVENETTRAFMLLTYLKLRTILHYRLQSSVFEPLAAPVWRRVLGLELHGSKGDGWAAKAHEEVRQELSKCIEAGSMQVWIFSLLSI